MPCKGTGSLQAALQDGIDSFSNGDENKLNLTGLEAECSADIDAAFQEADPQANRWDYFLCARKGRRHAPFYIEIHEVTAESVDLLVKKAAWLRAMIVSDGWPNDPDIPFLVAGKSRLAPTSPQYRALAMGKIVRVTRGDALLSFLE